ncbi:MAG: CRISPR-associated ring nuclease Csm6 [Kiritimatiellia bacterium]
MTASENRKHVLIAITGTAPAVLTEAVWGLATATVPVVPDKIVVLTTSKGRAEVQRQVLESGVWDKLVKTLAARGVDVADRLVFEEEMPVFTYKGKAVEDLPTRETNLAAANKMMQVIRPYAEGDEYVIHALMAGGRKTMSALFFSTMCLLGRRSDHIYHVLVSDGYEDRALRPQFFFPQTGVVHKATKNVVRGKKTEEVKIALKSEDCEINLFDVPFVPMGEWAEQKCRALSKGLTYENIINAVTESMDAALYPKVTVDFLGKGCVTADGKPVKVSESDLPVLVFLLQGFGRESVIRRVGDLKGCLDEMELDEQKYVQGCPCSWVGKFMWEDGYGIENEAKKAFYWPDGDKGGKKCKKDFARAKDRLKKAFRESGCKILSRILEAENDGATASGFDYGSVVWNGTEEVPDSMREFLFPPEAPFPVKQ